MIRSFHQRLVLLSCLLTGLTLAAFGTGAWWQLREQRLHRLDTDVLGIAEREAMRQRPAEEWSHVESDTAGALGLQRSEHLLMWARASDGRTLYRSPHWPAGIDSSSLIWPARPAPPPLAEPDAALDLVAGPDASHGQQPRLGGRQLEGDLSGSRIRHQQHAIPCGLADDGAIARRNERQNGACQIDRIAVAILEPESPPEAVAAAQAGEIVLAGHEGPLGKEKADPRRIGFKVVRLLR